ncbi:MAG: hypothetical protein MZW92_60800 [Comamonadaceae bacterium]|nr:hypothetical protein [Comamonadaceae bacterium]
MVDDFAMSFWLKHALDGALERDPVDAVNDAEILLRVLRDRLETVFEVERSRNNRGP